MPPVELTVSHDGYLRETESSSQYEDGVSDGISTLDGRAGGISVNTLSADSLLHRVIFPPPLARRFLCSNIRSSLRSISRLPQFNSCKKGCFYNHERATSWGSNVSNLLQLPISLRGKGSSIPSGDYKCLFDTGATDSYVSFKMFQLYKWSLHHDPVVVKNGDGSSQVSPGVVKVWVQIGAQFTAHLTLRVIHLARFQVILGLDTMREYRMTLLWEPRLHIRAKMRTSRGFKLVNLPICIYDRTAADGQDASDYVCEGDEFDATCKLDASADDVYAVVADDDNPLVLHHLVDNLVECFNDSSTPEEFRELAINAFSTSRARSDATRSATCHAQYTGRPPGNSHSHLSFGIRGTCIFSEAVMTALRIDEDGSLIDVEASTAAEASSKFTAPSAHQNSDLEAKFRELIIQQFPDLCSDSLPESGPSATWPDGSPQKIKLDLKPGMTPTGRRQFRMPEAYRQELNKTIQELLKYKLIEPSLSPYSNPVFFVPKPPKKDGSPGGVRVVWDGRGVNSCIENVAYLIPKTLSIGSLASSLKPIAWASRRCT